MATKKEVREAASRLSEIQFEIGLLVDEAVALVNKNAPREMSRARAYWIPQIRSALGVADAAPSMGSMQHTMDAMEDV
jgi:hypothetical protein